MNAWQPVLSFKVTNKFKLSAEGIVTEFCQAWYKINTLGMKIKFW